MASTTPTIHKHLLVGPTILLHRPPLTLIHTQPTLAIQLATRKHRLQWPTILLPHLPITHMRLHPTQTTQLTRTTTLLQLNIPTATRPQPKTNTCTRLQFNTRSIMAMYIISKLQLPSWLPMLRWLHNHQHHICTLARLKPRLIRRTPSLPPVTQTWHQS